MWLIILSLTIVVVAILALSRLIGRWLRYLLGETVYVWLFWPGVLVHELSHLIAALITFTKVTGFSVWPQPAVAGHRQLGAVTHQSTRNPFKLIIISLFPLVGGALLTWLTAYWLLPQPPAVPLLPLGHFSGAELVTYLNSWGHFVELIWSALHFSDWHTWLFIYLIVALSAHLMPSNPDLNYAVAGLIALALIVILLWLLTGLVSYPIVNILNRVMMVVLSLLTPLLSYVLALLLLVAALVGLGALLKHLNRKAFWY